MFMNLGSIKSLKFLKQLREIKLLKHETPTLLRKGPRPLLWAGSLASRGKITESVIHNRLNCCVTFIVKVKVKFTLEQATKAQKGSRGIAVLFL
jgi:hypothetical protein